MSKLKGFTLIELLVVIAIIARKCVCDRHDSLKDDDHFDARVDSLVCSRLSPQVAQHSGKVVSAKHSHAAAFGMAVICYHHIHCHSII